MKIRFVTYKRKSAKEEVDREEPLARQNDLIDKARRWKGEMEQEELVAELVDLEISGSTDQRPDLQRLIQMARTNQFKRAYIGITSRLFRDLPNGPELLYELREVLGKEIIFGDLLIPQTDPYYKRYEAQRFLDAQTASIDGSVGAKSGLAQLFKDGFKVGGRARYGYRLKKIPRGRDRKGNLKYNSLIEINPATFPHAQWILKRYAEEKIGMGAIATHLNRQGIPSPSAWDSWGNLLIRCSNCRYAHMVDPQSAPAAVDALCPQCREPLLLPAENKWTETHLFSILSEAEWTYSGHYRANYCSTRIKHGERAGQYKGGAWEGKDYIGQKLKPASEWRIRRDNHPAAIDAETCARIVAKREKIRKATPQGRRRSPAHPFPVICGECGSLFSRRGGKLLGCSGRDRKTKQCSNRAIQERVLYSFVARSFMHHTGLLDNPQAILNIISERRKKEDKQIHTQIRLLEKQVAKQKEKANRYCDLWEEDRIDTDSFVERMKQTQKEIDQIKKTIEDLKATPMDNNTNNAASVFSRIYSKETYESPEKLRAIAPHLQKLIAYTKLNPPDFKAKKRTVEVYYGPALRSVLNSGVPTGI